MNAGKIDLGKKSRDLPSIASGRSEVIAVRQIRSDPPQADQR